MLPHVQLAALAQSNCGLTTRCGANRTLSILYAVAAFLSLLLVGVLVAAIYLYRRNKHSEPK